MKFLFEIVEPVFVAVANVSCPLQKTELLYEKLITGIVTVATPVIPEFVASKLLPS